MTSHKIEININEIVNVDEIKEEPNQEIKMSSGTSAHMSSSTNHIVSNTIHVTQASKTPTPTPTPTTECQIFFEKYNKSKNIPIKCT